MQYRILSIITLALVALSFSHISSADDGKETTAPIYDTAWGSLPGSHNHAMTGGSLEAAGSAACSYMLTTPISGGSYSFCNMSMSGDYYEFAENISYTSTGDGDFDRGTNGLPSPEGMTIGGEQVTAYRFRQQGICKGDIKVDASGPGIIYYEQQCNATYQYVYCPAGFSATFSGNEITECSRCKCGYKPGPSNSCVPKNNWHFETDPDDANVLHYIKETDPTNDSCNETDVESPTTPLICDL